MIAAALGDLDLSAVFAALRAQEEHGHTAETDAELNVGCFGDKALRLASELRDVLVPGDRQNLDVAYRRAARLAAYAISMQRRIRLEQSRHAACNTGESKQ
jgi:hypothetical protein